MIPFIEHKGSRETYWRALILFGQNVASYKFALGKSLIEIVLVQREMESGRSLVASI